MKTSLGFIVLVVVLVIFIFLVLIQWVRSPKKMKHLFSDESDQTPPQEAVYTTPKAEGVFTVT
jgi:uncharacterized protein HemY